jgi:hypothetical protein
MIGTNSNHNGNNKQTILINKVEYEEGEDINDIRRNGYKGQNYNPNYQNTKNNSNPQNKCTFCHKHGYQKAE